VKMVEVKNVFLAYFLAVLFLFLAGCGNAGEKNMEKHGMKTKRIVLIGASVGKDWNFSGLRERAGIYDYTFESIAVYKYDKTEALEEVLMRPKRKFKPTKSYLKGFFTKSPVPADIIILKECAAYFPGDFEVYRKLMTSWVNMVKGAGKDVMVATVVPVTQKHAEKMPGRLEAILQYNDWLRGYAKDNGITLLDLEAALREGPDKRYLKDELTSGDGLHINKEAYALLDKLAADVCQVR